MSIESDFAEGVACHQLGNLDQAEACYQQVLRNQPAHAGATHYLGLIAHQRGSFDLAVEKISRAIDLAGEVTPPEFHVNLANALKRTGQLDAAQLAYQRALSLRPEMPLAWFNLGLLQRQLGAIDQAILSLQQACAAAPALAEAWLELGECYLARSEDVAAVSCFDRALNLAAKTPGAHEIEIRIGRSLVLVRRYQSAIKVLERVQAFRPADFDLLLALGCAQSGYGRLTDAERTFGKANKIRPGDIACADNLATVYKDQGQAELAVGIYRDLLGTAEVDAAVWSNYLFTLLYSDREPPGALYFEHLRVFGQSSTAPLPNSVPAPANPGRKKLRIGYVSGDLFNHPVAYFLSGILRHHDPSVVEVFVYDNGLIADEWTQRLKLAVPHWCRIRSLSDQEFLEQIGRDRIDVLIDLAGHTADNRLAVFSRRAAPVQVSYLGYPFSTAAPNMDWRVVDTIVDPPGAENYSTERLWRLPRSYYAYSAPIDAPETNDLPAVKNGFLTFGVCSNLAKVTASTLDHWAKILCAFPGAALQWRAKAFADVRVRSTMIEQLAARGISKKKLFLQPWAESGRRWHFYHQIDAALDTYPYNQATNTCEALWMGVPTLTVAGETHRSRMGASILTAAGLPDWIVSSPQSIDDWLQSASGTFAIPTYLAELRSGLRERIRSSELLDAEQLARLLEEAYCEMFAGSIRDGVGLLSRIDVV